MTAHDRVGEYPEDWERVALRVKEEADWRCVRCGHPDRPHQCETFDVGRGYLPCDVGCQERHHVDDLVVYGRVRRRVLTVHHLDGDKANVAWWNLLALCQVCHLQVQAKVDVHRTYLWPHTEWFRPYVAGYYAHAVLGEQLDRPEVEERLEELLALGQPHLGGAG